VLGDAEDRPFVDELNIGKKQWYYELEALNCLYTPQGNLQTLEERDFISLIGNTLITSPIADAYASQLFAKFASQDDVFVSSEVIGWHGRRKDFVIMDELLPSNLGSNSRVFCIFFHDRHVFLVEIIMSSGLVRYYDSIPANAQCKGYYDDATRHRMISKLAEALGLSVWTIKDGESTRQTDNNCVVVSLLNLKCRLQNMTDRQRKQYVRQINQDEGRLNIAEQLLATAPAGQKLLQLHHAPATILKLLEDREKERKLQKPILDMRSDLSKWINKRGDEVTRRCIFELRSLRSKLPTAILEYEAKLGTKVLLYNSSLGVARAE